MLKNLKFIGIGAYKSGTTWLVACLNEHPDVGIPAIKEINFFSKVIRNGRVIYWNYKKGLSWYQNQFKERENKSVLGEYSISYLCDTDTPKLIKKHFPEIKLIVCLRNPVDRLYSHYNWGIENFDTDKNAGFWNNLKKHPEFIENSRYHYYLSRYFKIFKKENIKVILYDDIKLNPSKVIEDCYNFLNVGSAFIPPSLNQKINPASVVRFKFLIYLFKIREWIDAQGLSLVIDLLKRIGIYTLMQNIYVKVNRVEKKYNVMSETDRLKLIKLLKPDIKKLEKMISKDLSNWYEINPKKSND